MRFTAKMLCGLHAGIPPSMLPATVSYRRETPPDPPIAQRSKRVDAIITTIQMHPQGISTHDLQEATGYSAKTLWGILSHRVSKGEIQRIGSLWAPVGASAAQPPGTGKDTPHATSS